MADKALVNPELLIWARNRARLDESTLAKKLGVKEARIVEWELGENRPTFRQAQKFAATTHVPFGYLFLPNPPEENFPLPDLRTIADRPLDAPSLELKDIVKQALSKQAWYREYLIENGNSPNPVVGSMTLDNSIDEVVDSIRAALNVGIPERGDWESYQRALIAGAEDAGIIVLRSGIVGNNTRRKLAVSEFRGFAIVDDYAPLVFINSSDAPAARLFTLIHELAHIWIGKSGISNLEQSELSEEKFCNAVAGEFLVPTTLMQSKWDNDIALNLNIQAIAGICHVSKLVVARRAFDLSLITKDEYTTMYRQSLTAFRSNESSGGDFYRTAVSKNGYKLSKAIVAEAKSGRLLLREAGTLLGIRPSSLRNYERVLRA